MKQNILERANEIVFKRSEERSRQYGDFSDSIKKTAKMASIMSNKEITPDDVYNIMIALKLVRESNAHKEDNILDAIGYLAQKNTDAEDKRSIHSGCTKDIEFCTIDFSREKPY